MNKFESKKKVSESEIENFISQKDNRGRKPINPNLKKNKSITFYLSESDYNLIIERAEQRRLSVSQYIVSKLFE